VQLTLEGETAAALRREYSNFYEFNDLKIKFFGRASRKSDCPRPIIADRAMRGCGRKLRRRPGQSPDSATDEVRAEGNKFEVAVKNRLRARTHLPARSNGAGPRPETWH
jgi:hypothetical protein